MQKTIHTTPEEILAMNSEQTVSTLGTTAQKLDENTQAIHEMHDSIKDHSIEIAGFTGVVNALNVAKTTIEGVIVSNAKVVQKIEEVKSAALITNQLLKKIEQKETPDFPDIPETDLSEVSATLTAVLEELQKPCDIKITLQLK